MSAESSEPTWTWFEGNTRYRKRRPSERKIGHRCPVSPWSVLTFVRSDGTPPFSETLQTPSGAIIDASGPGITYAPAVGIGDGSLLEAYIVDSPEDGDWIMRVAAVSVPAEGQAYVVTAPTDSPVTMTTSISEASVSPGETAGMTAVLQEGGSAITGATVVATVTKPDGSTAAVTLVDDGIAGDPTPDDGSYFGAFTDTTACGTYIMDFEATGVSSAGPFTRSDLASLEACADTDKDGFTDDIELFVGTDGLLTCGTDNWPPDLAPTTRDRVVDILDAAEFRFVWNSVDGDGRYVRRKDLNADHKIDILDVAALRFFFNKTCTP